MENEPILQTKAPDSATIIERVDALYMESDARIFKILHQIADLALRNEIPRDTE